MWNARLDESQAGIIKIIRRNINNLRYADDTTLLVWNQWRGTEEPLDKGKREEWKSWLETQHSKTKNSDPSLPCKQKGERVEAVTDFIFLGSNITADGNCSHEMKRRLLLGRKALTNLDSMLKSRDITLPTKVHIVKAIIFPAVMYGCWEFDHKEGWAPKNWTHIHWKNWCWSSNTLATWREEPTH